ncbi:Glycosyltransferase involved in cell wall bisynthesis [Prevotella sp. ne3005]|uniref:glycosyltransferase family 4 protein n=1 Tax=Prevotella sp. ne3005 TaxID=1761887 RepID=UPI0008D48BF7|nr:glycosyltransferase family 1 protein [Prevotella sp. ne3005]SEM54300.1 Glycosyltransferase involved in cell wall bisynthesis [Prevotella sp. ne3005]
MKIAVDCRFLGKSGIGSYIEGVLDILLKANNHYYLLIGNLKILEKYSLYSKCEVLECNIIPYSIAEQFRFPTKEVNKCDAFFSPNWNVPRGIHIPKYLTIHDVIFLDERGLTSTFGYYIRKMFLWHAVKSAKSIFTVSNFSKERIRHYFHVDNVFVTYSSVSEDIHKIPLKGNRKKGNYFLYVGNIKRHKGLRILLEGFNLAVNQGLNKKLIIVGEADNFKSSEDNLANMFTSDQIQFTGYVPNEKLYDYIMRADALVLPSRYEGFGLPPLEALYLGTDVILSDIPVLKEIYSNYPVTFFQCDDSSDLCNVIKSFKNSNFNIEDVRKMIDSQYSFINIANIIISAIEESNQID